MYRYFSVTKETGHILVLTLQSPDSDDNALGIPVLDELENHLDKFMLDKSIKGLVLTSGLPDRFSCGIDLLEIVNLQNSDDAFDRARLMQRIFDRVTKLKFPTVAAVNGTCLSSGLELALACTWRIATRNPETSLGFSEIRKGLMPHGGGTQRLPRLVGLQCALDMLLAGRQVSGAKAHSIGLVDACVPTHLLLSKAVELAGKARAPAHIEEETYASHIGRNFPKWAIEGNLIGRKVVYKRAKDRIDEHTKGFYPASYKILDAVMDGFETDLDRALEIEATLFAQLVVTRQFRALTHLEFATLQQTKRLREFCNAHDASGNQLVGVIGAGKMGAGICTACADEGLRVLLTDSNAESISRALKDSRIFFSRKGATGRPQPLGVTKKLLQITPSLSTFGLNRCDLIIEAVPEDLQLKRNFVDEVATALGTTATVFATNTSTIPIREIARNSPNPEKILGMHFLAPAEKIPLLEIVVSDHTSNASLAKAINLGLRIKKKIVIAKDSPGFFTTRVLSFYLTEALHILLAGAPIEQIDEAMVQFGFQTGPLQLIDEIGVDTVTHIFKATRTFFPDAFHYPRAIEEILQSGRLGKKNNCGFYKYSADGKMEADGEIYSLINVQKGDEDLIPNDEIVERCIMVFVIEAIRCLQEQVISDPLDGDVASTYGLGFPPFWGGPFKYVDFVGAKNLMENLKNLTNRYGQRFKPPSLLRDSSRGNVKFFPHEPCQEVRY